MAAAEFLLLTAVAASATPIQLFPDGSVPGERPGAIGNESGTSRISNVTVPSLTLLRAPVPSGAAIIVAPGGAYKFLSWELEGTSIAEWLNSLGLHVFILKYRVPARPWLAFGAAPLIDAQRAVGLVAHTTYTIRRART